MKIGVIVNPAAGRGKMEALWPRISADLKARVGPFEVRQTGGLGDGARFAEAFARAGMDLVIAVGGDGTSSEVVDGLLKAGEPRPAFALVPVGTGTDFVRNLSFGTDFEKAIDAIAAKRSRRIDAGRVSYTADDGSHGMRHFLNISSLGLSGPTVRAVNRLRMSGWRPGRLIFLYHTLKQLIFYRFQTVKLVFDDTEEVVERIAAIVVSNGQFFGAGMHIAPMAALDDGVFDVVIIRAAPKLRLLTLLATIYRGKHLDHPSIALRQARSVYVTPFGDNLAEAALLDIDGESPGRVPAHFEILPGALEFIG